MNIKRLVALSLFCISFYSTSARAQCRGQLCQNLNNILYNAETDFRGYRMNLVAAPDVSIVGARIPCRTTEWANAVAMYICSGEVPYSEAESWYINTLASARTLQPSWQFQINSPNADHFVDAGPTDCAVPATEGPYVGQCPLHFQITRQGNGMAKVYLWMSSLSSPYLETAPPPAPSRADPPSIPASCDDLCQGLKKAFEARLSDFTEISAARTNGGGTSGVTLKLDGAGDCNVDSVTKPHSTVRGAQYACYWPENSDTAANKQFQDLVSRFQVLTPAEWASRKEDQLDQLTGAKITEWCAFAPGNKQQVCVDILGQSVGLHITSWDSVLARKTFPVARAGNDSQ
jgi:hypothetical protein